MNNKYRTRGGTLVCFPMHYMWYNKNDLLQRLHKMCNDNHIVDLAGKFYEYMQPMNLKTSSEMVQDINEAVSRLAGGIQRYDLNIPTPLGEIFNGINCVKGYNDHTFVVMVENIGNITIIDPQVSQSFQPAFFKSSKASVQLS